MTMYYPLSCESQPSDCLVLADDERTVLFYGAVQMELPLQAVLMRWAIALVLLAAGVAAFYFNVVVPVMDVMKENARIKKAKARREARKLELERESQARVKETKEGLRRRAGSSAESKASEKKEPAKPAPPPKKPKRRCNQKRLKNILENSKTDATLGNPTEEEVEEALLENGDHAGKAMGWLIDLYAKKTKKEAQQKKNEAKAVKKLGPKLAASAVGDSVSKHGNHSYYHAHHARDLDSELKPQDFQMNGPKLLKKVKKKSDKKAVENISADKAEKSRLNIQNYSWAEAEAGTAIVTIPLRAVGELPEEDVTLEWEDRWVRISINNYENADHFFEITKAYCELKEAVLIRKPHKLELVLTRKSSFDQWYKLHHPGVIKSADDDDDE
jgi:hypothetical protein